MAKPVTPVLSAEELSAKWAAEEAGLPWPSPHVVAESLRIQQEARDAQAHAQEEARKARAAQAEAEQKAEAAVEKAGSVRNKYGVHEVRRRLDEILRKNGIDPAEELVSLALERHPPELGGGLVCDVDQRIKIWTELLSYQMPKLKSMEVAGQVDHSLTIVVQKFGEEGIGKIIELPSDKLKQVTEASSG